MYVTGKWDERGELTRIMLTGVTPREASYVSSLPGATASHTLPPEPLTLAMLERDCGPDSLDPRTSAWLEQHRRFNRGSLQLSRQTKLDVPITLAHPLYPYQTVGAMWLVYAKRAILGDDVGLGKTVQALTAAKLLGAKNVLIITLNIAKRSVWQYHCEQWFNQPVTVVEGSHAQRAALLKQHDPWIIVNHEMLRTSAKFPGLFSRKWDLVIVDEAHKFQGRGTKSKQSAGMEQIRAENLFLLTGTPVWNDPESLWHLLKLIEPYRFSSYWRFIDEYFATTETPWGRKVVGIRPDMLPILRSIVAPRLLKRLKSEVLTQLPDKTVQTITYDLPAKHRAAYQTLIKKRKLETPTGVKYYDSAAAALADARQLLNMPELFGLGDTSAKTSALLDLVDDTSGKLVVFCWHVAYAEYLQKLLVHKGYDAVAVTGKTNDANRAAALRRFTTEEDCKVFVGNIAAVGTAINDLVVASVAIFAEGSYVPAHNEQAEGRLHRNGQKNAVTVYRLQAAKTVEADLWELNDTRVGLSNDLLAFNELVKRVFGEAQ